MINDVRLADGERVERYRQYALQRAQTVRSHEECLDDVSPKAVARGDGKPVFIADQHVCIPAKAGRGRLVDPIHRQRLVSRVLDGKLQIRRHQER
jgi:hypothetical protein